MALAWRIRREISIEAEDETTWITLAGIFIAVSFLVLIGGVFLAPMQRTEEQATAWSADPVNPELKKHYCAKPERP